MVMAAGFGTRMGALTRDRPKPLLPLAGGTLIDHGLDLAVEAGVDRAVVNLHYRGNQVRAHLAERSMPQSIFSEEHPEILETGGGVVAALPLIDRAAFYTLNSDAVFVGPNPFSLLADAWSEVEADGLLLLVPRGAALAYSRPGDFTLTAPLARPERRGSAPTAPYVYTGVQIIRAEAFVDPPGPVFSTNIVWDRLLAEGRLAAIPYPGQWIDVGTPEGLETAQKALAS